MTIHARDRRRSVEAGDIFAVGVTIRARDRRGAVRRYGKTHLRPVHPGVAPIGGPLLDDDRPRNGLTRPVASLSVGSSS